jgi:hypothetical protein
LRRGRRLDLAIAFPLQVNPEDPCNQSEDDDQDCGFQIAGFFIHRDYQVRGGE